MTDVLPTPPTPATLSPTAAEMALPHLVPGVAPVPDEPEIRRNTATISGEDVMVAVGAAVAGVSATALIYYWLAPFSGLLGFVLV